jgi:integrase
LVAAPQTFDTKAGAARWLATVEADRARGLWVDPRAGRARLEEYALSWLASHARIGPRTREIYASQLRHHVLPQVTDEVPGLGTVALADLTPDLIRRWYVALSSKRSASTAAKAYTRLRQVLAQAVKDDRIAKNPCRIDHGGAERHPEQRFASLTQLYALAGEVPEPYRTMILMAGLASLRESELFALRWDDLDLDQPLSPCGGSDCAWRPER